jgi:hypothetical protein
MPEIVYDFDPMNLPQDILAAIGLVAAVSAQAEHIVEQAIGGVTNLDFEYTAAFCTHMNAPLRDNVLRAVAEIKLENLDELDQLDQLLDNLNEGFKRRNAYLHNSWCRNRADNSVFTVKTEARGSVVMGLVPVSVDQIHRDATFLQITALELYSFFGERGLLPHIPTAPRPRAHKTKTARKKRRKAMAREKK